MIADLLAKVRGRGPASIGMIVWLTVVWVLLWGEFSLANLSNGVLLALAITFVMPLPRLRTRYKIRPLALAVLVGRFLADVVTASFQVATIVLSGRSPRCAVVRIQLRSHNDLYLATTAGLTTLVPGSVAIEALKFSGIMYVHVLDVDPKNPRRSLDAFRLDVLAQEERLLRSMASDDELLDAGYDIGWRCQGPAYVRRGADIPNVDRQVRQ